jgi:beta-galactosidase
MSGVADADAGLAASEVQEDTEPAQAAAGEPAPAAGGDSGRAPGVPDVPDVPDASAVTEAPAGGTEAAAGQRGGAQEATAPGRDKAAATARDMSGTPTGPEQARAGKRGRAQAADRAGATSKSSASSRKRSPGRTAAPGASAGQARTAQARAGTPPRAGDAGATARSGKAGSPGRGGRKGGTPHATPSGPPARPAQGAGNSRRPQAGTAPRPGQAGNTPRRPGTPAPRQGQAGTAAPADAPPGPETPGSAPPGPQTVPGGPETAPPRPAAGEMAVLPARDGAVPPGQEAKAKRRISRRALIQAGLIGGAGAAALPLLSLVGSMSPSSEPQPTNLSFSLNSDWLFGGQYMAGSESSFYDDSGFASVTLPHMVTPLSWRDWNASAWEQIWIYRRHFSGGPLLSTRRPGNRIVVEFDGVMVNATVVINDHTVSTHQGGYLPFSAELTGHVTSGDNLLAVLVDANCLPVPPMSYGRGPATIDFFQPGGIYRDVRLRVLPQAFLSDLFALPADVLTPQRRVDVQCTIDSALLTHAEGTLLVELFDGAQLIADQAVPVSLDTPGTTTVALSLTGLEQIALWSTDSPELYTVQATLAFPGVGSHVLSRRIGFRDASFQADGFYLNGERLQLFGLNRHQLYPYAGMAMPARVQRTDAEILKNELNCNMVRCSHYPQSPHFLDACDELGLLVWEEAPGWHNVNASLGWQDLVVQNVRDMVTRDRSRPSVVIWGTRLNETPDLPGLWAATKQAADQLDGSRPSSGAMYYHSVIGWNEDVFAFNDYHHDREHVEALLRPPLAGLPYLITEAVGVDEAKPHRFSWTDPPAVLANQAILHGEAQSVAHSEPSYSGMLAWAAFDYASPEGLDPESVKWAGVADLFRVPKPGAAIYQSQVDPGIRPVIVPVFFWEPAGLFPAPAPASMIASNCERLEIFLNGAHVATGLPVARSSPYGDLPYPPFVVEFPIRIRPPMPELMIEGYVGGQQVTQLRMSPDAARDTLAMTADHATIVADGSDATRAVFRAVDAYGNLRRYQAGEVTLTLTGPATLIGDNPFAFGDYGGLGAVWIRSQAGQTGTITLAASHPELGQAQVQVQSVPATRGSQLA